MLAVCWPFVVADIDPFMHFVHSCGYGTSAASAVTPSLHRCRARGILLFKQASCNRVMFFGGKFRLVGIFDCEPSMGHKYAVTFGMINRYQIFVYLFLQS